MMQRKKKLSYLCFLILAFIISIVVVNLMKEPAQDSKIEIKEEQSDIADQKSVIDEQLNLPTTTETTTTEEEELLVEEEKKEKVIVAQVNIEEVTTENSIITETTTEIEESTTVIIENTEESIQKENEITYSLGNPYKELISGLTDYEKELICRITYREAGNQSIEGQRAVIEVILNRVLSSRCPNSVEGVLSQPGQFSTWALRDDVSSEDVARIQEVLNIVYTEEETVLPNCEYLFFDGVQHSYASGYIQIGDHWFGK